MSFQIYTTYSEVIRFLELVQGAADANRRALGFLPASAYAEGAARGKLWVVGSPEGVYCGHLLFGGSYPYLKVTQLFVEPDHRKSGAGSRLIEALVAYGEKYGYISASARVADDLAANQFWDRLGFKCSRQVSGGKTTGRKINIRVRMLDVPLLFERSELLPAQSASGSNFEYERTPVLQAPAYALDINSLLDLLRQRERYESVGSMIRAGFNHLVRLFLTHEAYEELSRNGATIEQSPALEFLRHLPVLPRVADADLVACIEDLRSIVFPRRSRTRKNAARDGSDLIHLATCIHYGLRGFVTSENALLRSAQEVKRQFGLDVLSPYEFLDPDLGIQPQAPLLARAGEAEIQTTPFEERSRGHVEEFLRQSGLAQEECHLAMHPGASGQPRQRICVLCDGRMVAFASWTLPKKLRPEVDFFLYVDESTALAEKVIEHLVAMMSAGFGSTQVCGIRLFHGPGQTLTRHIAVSLGFRSLNEFSGKGKPLFKLSVSGIVTEVNWGKLVNQVRSLAGVELPERMPSYEHVSASGLAVQKAQRPAAELVDVFELETLMSPGVFMFPGRKGIILPIQERYAEGLIGGFRKQMTFLPSKEALIRVERAYFRAPKFVNLFQKGIPVIFYISGRGGGLMQAIAIARITSSAVMPVKEAFVQHCRQGVLEESELERTASKGKVHVFTFDNLALFRCPVPFGRLKELDCIGGANLVTAQRLDYEQMLRLLVESLGKGQENAKRTDIN